MDEQTNVLARTLVSVMDREAELFARLGLEVERLKGSFQEKKWIAGLTIAQDIERYGERIQEADQARDSAFISLRDGLGMSRETAFSFILPRLPEECRADLESSWRRLRMAVVRLRTATGRVRYSAEALTDALTRALEGIFPYRKGRIYSRRGKPTSVGGSLLVDRKL